MISEQGITSPTEVSHGDENRARRKSTGPDLNLLGSTFFLQTKFNLGRIQGLIDGFVPARRSMILHGIATTLYLAFCDSTALDGHYIN